MQQITLERGDLLQLVPISNSGTIQLLPLGKKFKVCKLTSCSGIKEYELPKCPAIDTCALSKRLLHSGAVGCYEFKKGAPQTVFLSQPFDGPISCVAIGGNVQKKDKVFRVFSILYFYQGCRPYS